MSSWSDKVVLITGASSGIGRGLAIDLAGRGAKLGLVARRKEVLDEIITEISGTKTPNGEGQLPRVLAISADVQDAESMRAAAEQLRSQFGKIDVLIANAGIGGNDDSAQLDAAKFANVINTNVIGVSNSVAAVIPDMVKRGSGQLVVISSLAAYRGLPKSAAYCASKAAVSAMFESLRLDLKPRGIDVTIIHPGFIKTPLTAGRRAKLPWFLELEPAVKLIVNAIEKRKKSYAFPWQLAMVVRSGMIMPTALYDWIASRNSFRE
ncbi:MAG TPA: SDR family NAD(P)-dependent oxidoreductase [Pyrinomonadaceae bacterium]|nr:SDR family NAD(P)-dependent oxidoreductase [Pyrinomonadaceae bacterium]